MLRGLLFAMTLDLTSTGLGPDDNADLRIQVLDRKGAQRALYPLAEIRGTTGASALSYTRVGSVAKDSNLQVLITAPATAADLGPVACFRLVGTASLDRLRPPG